MKKLIIAIDGPGASGKGTLCQNLSRYFNIPHLSTGGLYRGTTRKAMELNVAFDNVKKLIEIAKNLTLDDINNPVNFTEEIGSKTPNVAKLQEVRDALFQYQKDFANNPNGAILDGRDIGTVICPDASYKFFVIASAEERAKRRFKEEIEKGLNANYDDILKKIQKRDEIDMNRSASPFKKADDAIEIDTTTKTIQEVFEHVKKFIVT
ncbi:MAG: (d)CMP kinase [Rickettsiales bacterium]|jgi:cytidylate kinase|nr:(d)CMP kinase [Rickettsiales bacterium]